MDVNASDGRDGVPNVLVVADWSVDPYGIVAACRRRAGEGEVTFALVVPARDPAGRLMAKGRARCVRP